VDACRVAQLGVEQFGFEVGEAFVEGIDLLSVGNELQPGLVHATNCSAPVVDRFLLLLVDGVLSGTVWVAAETGGSALPC